MRSYFLRLITSLLSVIFVFSLFTPGYASDYAPNDRCPYQGAEFYRPVYPLYEYRNRRLVLKDLETRADVLEVEINFTTNQFEILSWSPDCRYLAARIDDGQQTLVWDTVSSGRIATLDGNPVESWNSPNSLTLTNDRIYDLNSGNIVSITPQEIPVDISESQVENNLNIPAPDGKYYDCRNRWRYSQRYSPAEMTAVYQAYNHRLVLQTINPRQLVKVIEENVYASHFYVLSWSHDCRYMAGQLGQEAIIWDVPAGTRVAIFEEGTPDYWDPTSTYAIVNTPHGGFAYHILSGRKIQLTYGKTYFYWFQWNLGANQVRFGRDSAVVVVDLATGQEISSTYNNPYNYTTGTDLETVYNDLNIGCQYRGRTRGRYNLINAVARYESYNNRLVIFETESNQVIEVIEEAAYFPRYEFYGWSPGCQYFVAAVGEGTETDIIVWDVDTHARVTVLENFPIFQLRWSPDANHLLVESYSGGYLWQIPGNQHYQLTDQAADYGRNFHRLSWDTSRNQLLAVPVGAPNAVVAFDVNSGQVMGVYNTVNNAGPVDYFLSDDGNRIFVYTRTPDRTNFRLTSGIAIWDRNSQTSIQLDANYFDLHEAEQFLFSPDGRYLVVAQRGHMLAWDFNNLQGSAPYMPNYQQDLPSSYEIKFIDPQTIQTKEVARVQYQYGHYYADYLVYTWNLGTNSTETIKVSRDEWYDR